MRTLYICCFLLISFISLHLNAQNFLIHKVKQGESLYAIAKKYAVTIDAIHKNNPSLSGDNLKIGTELRIPKKKTTPAPTPKTTTSSSTTKIANTSIKPNNNFDTILHQVKPKETMYSISKLYDVNIDDIKKWNKLSSSDLSYDAIIKIIKPKNATTTVKSSSATALLNQEETKKIEEKINKKPTETTTQNVTKPEIKKQEVIKQEEIKSTTVEAPKQDEENKQEVKLLPLSEQFAMQKKENETVLKKATGAPMSTNDPSINNTFFALHKTAKVGSIIKVKNLENNKTSYAKVIGTLPEIDENKNVLIRLSLGVRKAINMGNGKAYLEMEFIE